MCVQMKMLAGKSAGRSAISRVMTSLLPAEPPMTMMSLVAPLVAMVVALRLALIRGPHTPHADFAVGPSTQRVVRRLPHDQTGLARAKRRLAGPAFCPAYPSSFAS